MLRRTHFARPALFVRALVAPLAVLALVSATHALQHGPRRSVPAPITPAAIDHGSPETVFTGTVVDTDGTPLAHAVVVTSEGGQAVTDRSGAFRLRVRLTSGPTSVQVTAVAGLGQTARTASAQVSTLSAGGTIATGTLHPQLASGCQPGWLPTFGSLPGLDGRVSAWATFDDGSGPALYAVGLFTTVAGFPVNGIAKWDGSSWAALGSETGLWVYALAVYDDGSGPALYAGGTFTTAGGLPASCIARWNGTNWSALGSGLTGYYPYVSALTVFDDGAGPALYAGGSFDFAGGVPATDIAKWDGSNWSPLGSGTSSSVGALAVFDDGSGPALYAASNAGGGYGPIVGLVEKWSGGSWQQTGIMDSEIDALAVFDDGGGTALYAGGWFTIASTVQANSIAKWDGASWSALGSGTDGGVYALKVFDDGTGPKLCAGGWFTTVGGTPASHIAGWDGANWIPLGLGITGPQSPTVQALEVFDDGSGPVLCAGGWFTTAGGGPACDVARWNGSSWAGIGGNGLNGSVDAVATFDDGSGMALYVGGEFTGSGGAQLNYIAKWNGSSWSAVGGGMTASGFGSPLVSSLAALDDGSGIALYAGGNFSGAGGVPASGIARWDGSNWSALTSGPFGVVYALAVFDDGSGPALYTGGRFGSVGGGLVECIEKWDGMSWSTVGSGITGSYVGVLKVYDDGTGPALYAGGYFMTAGGLPTNSIAKWDGANWSALGNGMTAGGSYSVVGALAEFDDGTGPALYAGGYFDTAGGVPMSGIAKWDGSHWSALGTGIGGSFPTVGSLASFDDGSGPALYVGGAFTVAGGTAANYVAKWDGSAWSAFGNGTSQHVNALMVFDDGTGPVLCVGGAFPGGGAGDSFLAKWGNASGCGTPGASACEPGAGGVITCPCGNPPLGSGRGCNNSSNTGGAQLSATGIARLSYDSVVFTSNGEKPTATSLVLQGSNLSTSGVLFGQGVRCVTGSLKRMYLKPASGGSVSAPQGADLHVHLRAEALGDSIAPGTHRYYAVYYRDATVLGGCPGTSGFNITQSLDLLWSP